MPRRFFVYTALVGALLLTTPVVEAQDAATPASSTVNIPLFAGETGNLTLGAWGSGKAEAVT